MFVGLALLVSGPAIAGAPQQDQHNHEAQAQQSDQKKMGQMKIGDMKMQANMEEMAAKKKANTERIAALMARIQTAGGNEKVAAMGDVIAILVDERAAMQEHCAAMCGTLHK